MSIQFLKIGELFEVRIEMIRKNTIVSYKQNRHQKF